MEPRLRPAELVGHHFTKETLARLQVRGDGLLSEAEVAVLRSMICPLEKAFAFTDNEISSVDPRMVAPMIIFTTAHVPWKLKPLPILRVHYDKLLDLQFIQDLRPVNVVTIRNSGVAPILDDYVELFAARAIYSMADLFSGYDQFQLELAPRELTAMQTPLGLLRLSVVSMGATNSVGHVQAELSEIFGAFIPRVTLPFIDDLSMRGARYDTRDKSEVSRGVRRFVHDHALDVAAILRRAIEVGVTFSSKKSSFGLREIGVVGFVCNEAGRAPGPSKIAAIGRMGSCRTVSEVRRFLGAVGFYRIFIPHYADVAEPLYSLLRNEAA
ncbi:MAG: hypothetical protein BJ554DRAFT_4913 [Olpidium bornovanus]|uniref:Uncharacterized protein n=1 Tax=Olpidium bornovanus TaxID=278681 RepID=A0A8H7ZZN7_9FUNG|nr:MAG: hypothetical protein BJ554DRAFT_4913 [Olpidium bornovanus]